MLDFFSSFPAIIELDEPAHNDDEHTTSWKHSNAKRDKKFLHLQNSYLRCRYNSFYLQNTPIVLAQKYRLQGKDVIFLSRKRQYFSAGLFGFFYRKQYPNNQFNQLSLHITIKYSKRSTQRNALKRAILQQIQDDKTILKPINGYYYKLFIVINKHKLDEFQQKIANFDKNAIIIEVKKQFSYAWEKFISKMAQPRP